MQEDLGVDVPDEFLDVVWRNLCAGLIVHAAARVEESVKLRRNHSWRAITCVSTALRWLEGSNSLIPYSEACRAVGVDPDKTKQAIEVRANARKRKPMSDYVAN